MKSWFTDFENCLRGEAAPTDLIGAGNTSREKAMAHYRFQHGAKLKEAVEVTFPELLKHIGADWEDLWTAFREQNTTSPRSLDWFPEVFLNYFLTTSAPLWQKELARFEHLMDIHPWSHRALPLIQGYELGEESKIVLGAHELISFAAPVTRLYKGEAPSEDGEEVVLWNKEGGVHFRKMLPWEIAVLKKLSEGLANALEEAPEDPESVGKFFEWLGGSCLIQDVR